jgi:hypothetical protein
MNNIIYYERIVLNMINQKFFGIIILLSLSLIGLVGFAVTTGNTIENIPLANSDPSITQTTGTQVLTETQATGSKFSGEILTCTNLNNADQVIDLRIRNLDVDNLSISIDPLSKTIKLLPDERKSIDLSLPFGVSSLILSSNDEKLTLQVPPCISRGGSSGNSHISFSSSNGDSKKPPPPVPELSTMALTGIGIFGLIFIINRSKQ